MKTRSPIRTGNLSLVRLFLFLVAFSLAGSLLTRLTRLDPGPIAPIASLLTLSIGVLSTFQDYVKKSTHPWPRLVLAFSLGTTAEILGLATGWPFGRYAYTEAWWPTFRLPFGPFPILLPFAWLLMTGASRLSLRNSPGSSPFPTAVLAGLVAATIDLAMEPVMAGSLAYWKWLEPGPLPGGAPIANFLGWWGTASLASLALTWKTPTGDPKSPRWILVGFLILILGLGAIRA